MHEEGTIGYKFGCAVPEVSVLPYWKLPSGLILSQSKIGFKHTQNCELSTTVADDEPKK